MSGPDWTKAPDRAGYWIPQQVRVWGAEWYKQVEGRWYYHHESLGWLREMHMPEKILMRMVKRP